MTTTSADPELLQRFLDEVVPARRASEQTRVALARTQAWVRQASPDHGVDVESLLALGRRFEAMRDNERFVATIHDELLLADRSAVGPVTVGDAAITAALDGAGVGAPPPAIEFEAATLVGLPPTSGFVDDPICAANGNMVHRDVDLVFPGLAAALDVARTYNSMATTVPGAFGPGWSSMLDVALRTDGADVVLTLADGAAVRFREVDGTWTAFGRRVRDLDRAEDGSAIVVVDDATALQFGLEGELTGWRSGAARVAVERHDGRVVRVVEQVSGRSWEVAWTDGGPAPHVTAVTSNDGRRVAYDRDDTGRLVAVRSAAGRLDYEWSDGFLVAVVDADGVRPFRNRYDASGRVVHQTNEFGRGTEYRYEPGGLTVVVGDDDVRQAMVHDRRGNLTAVVDVDGSAMRFEYDHLDRVVQVTSRGGVVTRYRYDDADRLVERTDPDGLAVSWTWDDAGRVTSRTLRGGGTTSYEYAGALRSPVRIVDPTGAVTTAEIDPVIDEPVAITDADGVTIRLEHDADGQPVAAIDAHGARTELAYDPAGRLLALTDALGTAATLGYDAAGRVVRSEHASAVTTYARTPAGRIVAGTEPGGIAWSATLGEHGAPVVIRDGTGAELGLRYDAMGNRTAVVAPDGAAYRSEHDAVGRLVAVVDPMGGATTQAHDRDGHVVEVTDPAGRTTRRELDPLGRTALIEDAAGGIVRYRYHPDGQVASVTLADGTTWRSELDRAGRTVAVVDPAGGRTELDYTSAGRLRARRSPAGRVETFEYDAAGRAVAKIDAAGVRHAVERDAAGRLTALVDPTTRSTYGYDTAGRVTAVDLAGRRAAIGYDPGGRVTALADGTGARTELEWDVRGLLAAATDPAGARSTYEHDVRGRPASQTTPGGGTTTFTYDAVGRLAGSVDPGGIVTRYERDAAGFVTAQRRGGAGWRRELDGVGREARRFDVDDALLAEYERDPLGRLVRATGATGWTTELGWEPSGLARITDRDGTTAIERDADGLVVATVEPDGATTRIARDALGRIVGVLDDVAGAHDVEARPRVVDRAGRLLAGPDGSAYRYDAAGRIVEIATPGRAARRLAYRSDGLVASERSGELRRRFDYDAAGRVRVVDVDGVGVTTFEYDDAGRRTAEVRPDGTRVEFGWTGLEHLTTIVTVTPAGDRHEVAVEHDGFGRPVRVGGAVIAHDPVTGLPSLIGDTRLVHAPDGTWRSDDARWAATPADRPDGLTVGRYTFLARRVVDAGTHQFLSPDPLLPVPATAGAASAHTYAWQDPVNHVDPSGLRPISQEEWTRMRELEESGRLGQAWNAIREDPWGALAVGAMVAGAIVLGGPVGVGILIGAGVAAGTGLATGTSSPRQVLLGGALGGVGGAAAAANLGVGAQVALGAGSGAVGDLGGQLLDGDPAPIDWWSVGVAGTLGGVTSRVGATQFVDNVAQASARNAAIVGATTDGASSIVRQALTGDHSVSLSQVAIDAAGGGAGGYFEHRFMPRQNAAAVPQPDTTAPLMLEAGSVLPSLTTGGDVEMITVYRGTSRAAELRFHAETGLLLSDAAQLAYAATLDVDVAIHYSAQAHEIASTTWGGEAHYVEAHGAFGHEIVDVSGDRTMVSVTTDRSVAEYFADKGVVFTAEVPADTLLPQTLQGAGESELLARHAIGMRPLLPEGSP